MTPAGRRWRRIALPFGSSVERPDDLSSDRRTAVPRRCGRPCRSCRPATLPTNRPPFGRRRRARAPRAPPLSKNGVPLPCASTRKTLAFVAGADEQRSVRLRRSTDQRNGAAVSYDQLGRRAEGQLAVAVDRQVLDIASRGNPSASPPERTSATMRCSAIAAQQQRRQRRRSVTRRRP